MNKRTLVERIARKSGCSQKNARRILDIFLSETIALLEQKRSVRWGAFGTFYWMRTKTGRRLIFRSGKALLAVVDNR